MSHVQAIMNHLEDLGADRDVIVEIATPDGYTRTYDVLAAHTPLDEGGPVTLATRLRGAEPSSGPPEPEVPGVA